jgi:glycosidase
MMNEAAIFHRATEAWCYPLDENTLHLRLQAAAGDVKEIFLLIGDPFYWDRGPEPGQGAHAARAWMRGVLPMRKAGSDGVRDFWEARYSPPYRRSRYLFRIHATDGSLWDYGEQGLFPLPSQAGAEGSWRGESEHWNAFHFPYINPEDVYAAPSWVSGTVWYQIFPDRFRNGHPGQDRPGVLPWAEGPVTNRQSYGGDLAGVAEKLDYLAELGVNGLYLTPIFASPSVHKYDTEDYLRIDPSFGTEENLRRLVDGCHERGMKIVLDAVFNHSGRLFGPWLDVLEKGRASRYASWFSIRSWPLFPSGRDTGDSRESGFATFAFTTGMPRLDTSNPELREYLLGVAERYVRDFGIDGWRLDVAGEVGHEFWRAFRARMKALSPELYLVGEIWHDSMPWLRGDQFDAVMNYPAASAIIDFLVGRHALETARCLEARLAALDFSYPEPVKRSAFNLLDSHDTERVLHRLGEDLGLARLAWLLLFLLPGSPCIYYGSEIGLSGGGDPDNRRCMIWDEARRDRIQYGFMRALVQARRRRWQEISEGARRFLYLEEEPRFLALEISSDGGRLLALVNATEAQIGSARIERLVRESGSGPWAVLLSDPREEGSGGHSCALLPRGFRLLFEGSQR